MSSVGRGKGGRGSSPPSGARCRCGSALSRSSGRRAWSNFNQLNKIFWPTLKRLREVERAWYETKEAAAVEEEGAEVRVAAAREEYDLAFVLFNSLMEYHLGKPGDDEYF